MKQKIIWVFVILALIAIISFFFFLRDRESQKMYENYTKDLASFKTNAGDLKYLDKGVGQPILLLHGVPTSSWMYRNLAEKLANNGYRVIVPDMIGFGASSKPNTHKSYSFDMQANRILKLMDHLEIESWEQVTHDMGGIITWEMIKAAPTKINHLYILNTIIYAEDFHPPADFSLKNPLHVFFLQLHGHKYIGKMIVENMLRLGTNNHLMDYDSHRGYWMPLRDNSMALVHFFTNTKWIKQNLVEYRKDLKQFPGEISIIWGKNDPFLGVEQVKKSQAEFNISDENILILPNAKHLIAEESADQIFQFITKK